MKTPLYDTHVKYGGKIVPFAGYLLPVQYQTGIAAEHIAVRTAAGLFDVSHMGEITLKGMDALKNVQMLVTNDCSVMYDGQVKYSPMCNENGGVVDDLLVYKIGDNDYMLVVNAANHDKDVEWIKSYISGDVEFKDISQDLAQIAVQGPNAYQIVINLADKENLPVKYYSFTQGVDVGGFECIVSKTGYSGEEGYELYTANENAAPLWEKLMEAGKDLGLIPCGLGARDTLRLEAAMPLYGHEMNDVITPFETGIGFFVKMTKDDFIGKAALQAKGEPKIKRIGL
ncbi:MAG: glycine cleavage system aminomethyltransferase GcvT, partial [Eubacteriales bacterium]